ncbi:MAG: DinB family protein [Chloroflexi bacterium]|nr:MAG: DinB family protein [Chloroflexota bacterium]
MTELRTPEEYTDRLEQSYKRFSETLALLEPAEYNAACLPEGWTPTAIVAHVAFWDDFQRRRMEAALTGAWAEDFPRPAEDNNIRAAADGWRAWEDVLAEADANRQKLVDFSRGLSAEQIAALYREDGKERPVLQILLEQMARHAREHAQTIQQYCGSWQRWGRTGFRVFYARQSWNFLDTISGLSEATCLGVPVVGVWCVREMLAHVLVWDEYCYQLAKQWPAVELTSLAAWINGGFDEVNERLVAEKAGMGMIDLLDALVTVHRRILRHYDKLSDEAIQTVCEYGWGQKDTLVGVLYGIASHTAEHAAHLYEARRDGLLRA